MLLEEFAVSKSDFILESRLRKLDDIEGLELRTTGKGNRSKQQILTGQNLKSRT